MKLGILGMYELWKTSNLEKHDKDSSRCLCVIDDQNTKYCYRRYQCT